MALRIFLFSFILQVASIGATDTESASLLRKRSLLTCSRSADCGNSNYYCEQGTCAPKGTCAVQSDCQNPWNDYRKGTCASGSGYEICSNFQCVTVCGSGSCPRGQAEQDCSSRPPCDFYNGCTGIPRRSRCVNDSCGSCRALFFDPKGNNVCTALVEQFQPQPSPTPPAPTGGPCSNCRSDQYCMRGTCRNMGYCEQQLDCKNPANQFSFFGCPGGGGYMDCISNQCQPNCSVSSSCPAGVAQQNCNPRPCDLRSCRIAVNCYDEACGECNPIFFDSQGYEVCTVDVCNNDSQCDFGEYCGGGRCLEIGSCQTFADCQNPSNTWTPRGCPVNGYRTCNPNSGRCELECSTQSGCPPGKPYQQCSRPMACDMLTCNESSNARCVNYSCGGCEAVFFDPAGNQICEDSFLAEDQPCRGDSDCSGNTYCANGICADMGTCSSREDCLNPANRFPQSSCEGYISCNTNSGMCEKTCSNSVCPPGLQFTPGCTEAPCGTRRCSSARSNGCVNDYCGGCNAIFFDSRGNTVCPGCRSDNDCGSQEYCGSGECRRKGSCRTVVDCRNDSNQPLNLPDCGGGYLMCQNGSCTLSCTGTPCPFGQAQRRCFPSPCAQTNCPVSNTKCVDDICGGCNAIIIDRAGSQVCDGIASTLGGPP